MIALSKEAKNQAARLGNLRGTHYDALAMTEYANTLCRACKSLEHVRETVDAIMRDFSDRPTPAEVRVLAEKLRGQAKSKRENCEVCHGTGYVQNWYLVTCENNPEQQRRRVIRQRLTEPQALELGKKVGYKVGLQYVTVASDRCTCMPPIPEEIHHGGYR